MSQLHAELERLGRHWVVSDDGLSRHGSYLNGERLSGRCRLRDGDELRVGSDHAHLPPAAAAPQRLDRGADRSAAGRGAGPEADRPPARGPDRAGAARSPARAATRSPATNRQIAEETHLSVDAVKRHLRILFERFGIGSLPQNEKRVRLVELALQAGLISMRDLTAPPR